MSAAALPVLAVHLDVQTGELSWKPRGVKGARWRKAQTIYEACSLADDVIPTPRDIDFVSRKD